MNTFFRPVFFAAIVTLVAVVALPAVAQGSGWRLVCFEKSGLTKSLDKVTNAQQFLRNDRILKSGSCAFAQIPSNSSARFAGFHESPQGFIYPTFQVRYATTGQRMYAADGVFLSSAWLVSKRLRDCRTSAFQDTCLVPIDCQAFDGFVGNGQPPSYIAVPEKCRIFRTN
ncbi:MAG: hypothetical protein ACSHXD_19200 [Marinosulfonomonas sp.]